MLGNQTGNHIVCAQSRIIRKVICFSFVTFRFSGFDPLWSRLPNFTLKQMLLYRVTANVPLSNISISCGGFWDYCLPILGCNELQFCVCECVCLVYLCVQICDCSQMYLHDSGASPQLYSAHRDSEGWRMKWHHFHPTAVCLSRFYLSQLFQVLCLYLFIPCSYSHLFFFLLYTESWNIGLMSDMYVWQ